MFIGSVRYIILYYIVGLKWEPNNQQLQDGLAEVRANLLDKPPENPFASADVLFKLKNDPRTRAWLDDPEYLQIISDLQNNPNSFAHR